MRHKRRNTYTTHILCVLACWLALAAQAAGEPGAGSNGVPPWGIGPFVRDDGADQLRPNPDSVFACPVTGKPVRWEDKDILCAAATVKDGQVFVFYRAEDKSRGDSWGTSRLGLAISPDGRHFVRRPAPVLYPDNDFMKKYEWPGGCQDPRIVEADDGSYVMTYTAWDGKAARLCVATSPDLYHWTKRGLAIGNCRGGKYRDTWSKSGAIVCRRDGSRFIAQKIHGQYWMYFGDTGARIATSENLVDWTVVEDAQGNPLTPLPARPGKIDSLVTEPGPPAFLTERGILLLYNAGANRPDLGLTGTVWAVAQALFDPADPTRLLDRMDSDFFHPERDFEIRRAGSRDSGNGNVTFVESLIWLNGSWRFYYGCADSLVASAVCGPPGMPTPRPK
jgi:predicted GH43/DUF377 family glycosyl hydrolase